MVVVYGASVIEYSNISNCEMYQELQRGELDPWGTQIGTKDSTLHIALIGVFSMRLAVKEMKKL